MNLECSQPATFATSPCKPQCGNNRLILNPSNEAFPKKLRRMLDEAERKRFAYVVGWVGREHFKVFDPKAFEENVLQHFFFSTKYKSFTRQLNLYGFQRVLSKHSRFEGCYHHPLFRKDRPELASCIGRQKTSGDSFPRRFLVAHTQGCPLPPSCGKRAQASNKRSSGSLDTSDQSARQTSNAIKTGQALQPLDITDILLSVNEAELSRPVQVLKEKSTVSSDCRNGASCLFLDWVERVPVDIQHEIMRTFIDKAFV